ncbi:hypothetical protein K431DRAFT_281620 [Polychaeton citri CBS 116435]|uniref:Kinetochore protein Sos7 coiled-coil domain-containing protein n=1 Tax=Polychaeton citri CBS 116435 TaxID=1314669 RepID=A0A9P4QGW9_9PEZI|nr:hypothetical protein K431DRAFT_281620 [Polychaeton citri CBS 116435]
MEPSEALQQLDANPELHILKIASPYLSEPQNKLVSKGSSRDEHDVSSPLTLLTDLKQYQELFGKLRFSYTEQVTKEKFLRAVTSDPPEFVSSEENVELEQRLREEKAALKRRKEEVRQLIMALDEQGRELARRYEHVQLQRTQLDVLPSQINALSTTIEELKQQQHASHSDDPDLNLPLQPTVALLNKRNQELADLDRQIALLRERLPHKQQEAERLKEDVELLQRRKEEAVKSTQEAQRKRAAGGSVGDGLEEKARWLKAQGMALRGMLEV